MDRTRMTALIYHLFLILTTIGIPLLIIYAVKGGGEQPGYGWVGAALAFIVLLAYTLITYRNRGQS